MGLGTNHVTTTTAATFIPEIWSDEIVAAYKKNLVLANLVSKMNHVGKKGDTIHIPKPTRGAATAKAANTEVTLIAATEADVQVSINKHYEYSRLIEDITDVQAQPSLRKFYTDDAGYALATQIDSDISILGKTFGDDNGSGSDYVHSNSFYIDAGNGLAAYAANTVAATDVFTDLAFREAVQQLDDNDVPMDGRFLVIPPSVRTTIMGIDRYQSSDFVDNRGVVNGQIGSLYGIDIYVSNNLSVVAAAGDNSASAVDLIGCIMAQRDAMVLVEQIGVRTQTQYKQEFLGDLMTADTLYGVKTIRPESGLVISVPKN
jgi:N4-gp56 family major capsid protein|tara:strand:- start:678 stop:1628 length:951 start_codon:yes stop_codon:yes gene_type:complete